MTDSGNDGVGGPKGGPKVACTLNARKLRPQTHTQNM